MLDKTLSKRISKLERKYEDGKYSEVLKIASRLVTSDKKQSAKYHDMIGCCLVKLRKVDDAIKHFELAVEINPSVPGYIEHLLVLASQQNSLSRVIESLCEFEGLSLNETSILVIHTYVEKTFSWQGLKNFETLVGKNLLKVEKAYICLGMLFFQFGRINDAIVLHEKIAKQNPFNTDNLYRLCVCHHVAGNNERAHQFIGDLLNIEPKNALALYTYTNVLGADLTPKHVSALLNVFESERGLPKVQAGFSLGKYCNKLQDFETAYKFYSKANYLELLERDRDLNIDSDFVSETIERFKNRVEVTQKNLPNVKSSSRSILIVGMPRSGTSLVEQILASHSEVAGLGELNFLFNYSQYEMIQSRDQKNNLYELSKRISSSYIRKVSEFSAGKQVLVDKLPGNYRALGYLLLSNPDTKVINVQRNPMAVAWSIYTNLFPAKNLAWTFSLDTIYANYKLYLSTMHFWKQIFPDRILDFNYEKLTVNQRDMTMNLLQFCDLTFEESCLNFHETKRNVNTASTNQVRKKIYVGSSEAWKDYEPFLGDYPEIFNSLNQ